MEKINKDFEDEWRKAFEDAEEQPSGALWQNIENRLAQKDIVVYKRKYFYTQVAAAVLLLLFLPLSGYFIYHFKNESLAVRTQSTETSAPTGQPTDEKNQIAAADKVQPSESGAAKSNDNSNNNIDNQLDKEILNTSSSDLSSLDNTHSQTPEAIGDESSTVAAAKQQNLANSANHSRNPALGNEERSGNKNHNKLNQSHSQTGSSKDELIALDNQVAGHNGTGSQNNSGDNINTLLSGESPNNLIGDNKSGRGWNTAESSNVAAISKGSNNKLTLERISGKDAIVKEVKPKQIYLYFWQNESLYVQEDFDKKEEKKKFQRWYANVDFSPSYTNQNFQSVNSAPVAPSGSEMFFSSVARTTLDQSAKELEMLSKPQFSYTSGLNGAYRINSKLSVEVGLKYVYSQAKVFTNFFVEDLSSDSQFPAFNMVLKEATPEQTISAAYADNIASSSAAVYNSFNKASSLSNSKSASPASDYKDVNIYTQYVGIPLTVNYKLIDKRLDISMGGGLSTDIFLQYGSKKDNGAGFESETITRSDRSVFKPYTFSFLIAPEIEYGISSRSSVYLRPVYKGALHSFTDQEKLLNKPHSTGVGFGLRYNFQ